MRRSLIVGVDAYPDIPLTGCVADAHRMHQVLANHHDGSPNFDCRIVTCPGDTLTRASLRQAITQLFAQPADIVWLHFSGHGTSNGFGGYLVTPDFENGDVGVPMTDILTAANSSRVAETIITLDCCHSGTFGSVPSLRNDQVALSDGVSVVTATRANEAALEVGGGGVFTSLLVEALEGGAAGLLGDITVAGVYAFMDSALGAWDQRPLFKANVSRFVELRKGAPRVPREILRKICSYFPLPAEDHPLDPSYEPSVEPRDPTNEAIFRDLQKLRAAGLVEPVDEEHMYFAAVNSKACQLTNLGLYYWRLVKQNRI